MTGRIRSGREREAEGGENVGEVRRMRSWPRGGDGETVGGWETAVP